jgi:hypothetical protein
MPKLPPHKQRRLNARIQDVYGGKYADWYELAKERQAAGDTLQMIRAQFAALGISVCIYTVHDWMKKREAEDLKKAHAA